MTKRQQVFLGIAAEYLTKGWREGLCGKLWQRHCSFSFSVQDYKSFIKTNWGQPIRQAYWWPLVESPDENRAMFCILMATISDEDWMELTKGEQNDNN